MPACLIEARKRRAIVNVSKSFDGPRFGFTVTKKLGNAVIRNRIRRRLKAAIAELAQTRAQAGFDYVIVARAVALNRPYPDIVADLCKAFAILHSGKTPKPPPPPKNLGGKTQP